MTHIDDYWKSRAGGKTGKAAPKPVYGETYEGPKGVSYGEMQAFDIAVDALAEKYNLTKGRIMQILNEAATPQEILRLDWKDLDAIVQEGLAELGR